MASIEWETPQDFFDELDREFHFTLDPCATKENKKCDQYISKGLDGLSVPWSIYSDSVFVNPPYDRGIGKWLKKAYEESQKGITVVCLIQGRSSDTIWWHDYVMRANEIRYVKDRLHFGLNGKFSRANISSVVIIFTPYCKGPPKNYSINTMGQKIKKASGE